MLNEVYQTLEDPKNLALDESIIILKDLCNLIQLNRMDLQDKFYLIEIIKIIEGMETPVLINEGSA